MASVVNFYIHLYLICECWKFYRQTLKLCLIVWLPTFISLLTVCGSFFYFFDFGGTVQVFQAIGFLHNPHFCSYQRKFCILFVCLLTVIKEVINYGQWIKSIKESNTHTHTHTHTHTNQNQGNGHVWKRLMESYK